MKDKRTRGASLLDAFRSLRNRNYRLYWFGQLVSVTGTWMQDVALGWFVLDLTDSPEVLGLTMAIRFLPIMLFSLHGGVWADRLPKRRTLMVTQGTQFIVPLTLAVLISTGHITMAIIYALVGFRGLVDAIDGPTRQAFVPELVGREDLPNAIALNSTVFNSARVAGPAIAAAVISLLGMAACFYINAASYAAVIAALLSMRVSELNIVPRQPGGKMWPQLREGLQYVKRTPEVMVMFLVLSTVGTFGFNFQTTLPLIVKYVLLAGASTLGVLFAVMGVGSVLAGLVSAHLKHFSQRLLLGAASLFTVLLVGVGLSDWLPLTVVLLFLSGFAGVLWMISTNTRLQMKVPDHLRGRVMGIYLLLFAGTTPIGSFVSGQLAENISSDKALGVKAMILIMAGLCATGLIAGVIHAQRSRRHVARAGAEGRLPDIEVVGQV